MYSMNKYIANCNIIDSTFEAQEGISSIPMLMLGDASNWRDS